MLPLLDVRGLSLSYPNGKRALIDVDLEVRPGELLVVLGGNGCGKTTLLRCITRALTPTAGEVWLNGTELTPLSGDALRRARLDIAMVWQQANLIRRRSVLANVASGALGRHQTWWTALGGLPAAEVRAAPGHLRHVGLAHLTGQRAGTLSGGQAQRVAIARALAQGPRLLLADEPVASLDPEAADGIMRLLRRLAHDDGLAVLVRAAPGRSGVQLCRPRGRDAGWPRRIRHAAGMPVARTGATTLSGRGGMSEQTWRTAPANPWGAATAIALRTGCHAVGAGDRHPVPDRRAGAATGFDHRRLRHGGSARAGHAAGFFPLPGHAVADAGNGGHRIIRHDFRRMPGIAVVRYLRR